MRDLLHKGLLGLRTARYKTPRALAHRLLVGLRRRLGFPRKVSLPAVPSGLHGRLDPRVPFPHHDPWNRREALLERRFCFLRQARSLGDPVDWQAPGTPLLWRYWLHYFQYLHLLRPEEQVALCRDWVAANPTGQGVGWHAYPTSLRVLHWCQAGVEELSLLASLYRQAAYLHRNLETYIGGNHLLENARALAVAGCFFDGQGEAPAWLSRGLALFRTQTPIQILPDGGHYERSPMYHALALEGYLDLLNLLPEAHPDRALLLDAARRMFDFLVSMTHPDGSLLALFNDATREIALPTPELVRYAREVTGYEPEVRHAFAQTGYFIHDGPSVRLIIDGGSVSPDDVTGHAHADIFSFELSLGGLPMVVDSGVYEYAPGAMRDYVRGTPAHSTVCVDGVDQAECWHSFQLARRYPPRDVSFRRDGPISTFDGRFDGYARLIGDGIVHRRQVVADATRREIRVRDTVTGRGVHTVASRLQLHPEVAVSRQPGRVVLKRGEVTGTVEVAEQGVTIEEGWYCPEFGRRMRRDVVVITHDRELPVRSEYLIRY